MKNKKSRLVIDALLIILGITFLVFGIKDFKNFISSKNTSVSDAEKFKSTYQYVEIDNIYEYINAEELLNILESDEERIILIGNPLDPWTQVLVSPLNDIVKPLDRKIYYYEFDKDSKPNNYEKLAKVFNVIDLSTPMIVIKTKSEIKVIYNVDLYEMSYSDAPIDYWTDARIEVLNKKIKEELE